MSRISLVLGISLSILTSMSPCGAVEITLKNSFIDTYRKRITIDADFIVDKAHAKPNTPSKDGDLHVAGRSDDVELMTVAEIMNAKSDPTAVSTIHTAEGSGSPVEMTGVWRIWCEHGGSEAQVQGANLDPATSTNPDHVFEIHPVTKLADRSLLPTLKKTSGFKYKDAEAAFSNYESRSCDLTLAGETTTIDTPMAGYNYVEFILDPLDNPAPEQVTDGHLVFASVHDLSGELLVHKRRMAFVAGSTPEQKFLNRPAGKRVRVIGIPRINLDLVWFRTRGPNASPEMLTWELPYEIVVVAFVKYVT